MNAGNPMPLRFDSTPISSWEKLWDGRLRVKATFSKVGPLAYVKPDGSTQIEIVPAEELFRQDSLETAAMAAVTLNHPPEGIVTPRTWKKYNVGASGSRVEARMDEGLVEVVYVIGDEEAIKAVQEGDVSEVSVGYQVTLDRREDGLYQTNRQYNHHALVPKGRAGASVRLHYDNADDSPEFRIDAAEDVAWLCDADMGGESPVPEQPEQPEEDDEGPEIEIEISADKKTKPRRRGDSMTTTNTDANKGKGKGGMVEYRGMEMSEDAMKAMKDLETQVDGMGKGKAKGGKMTTYKGFEMSEDAVEAMKELENQVDMGCGGGKGKKMDSAIEAERDMLKARVDSLQSELDNRLDAAAVETLAQAKLNAFTAASPYLPADTRFDAALSPVDWKRQAIAAASPNLNLDGKDEAYITAAFDVLSTTQRGDAFKAAASAAQVGGHRESSLNVDADIDEEQIRKDAYNAVQAAYCWKEDQ
jgi:hypothetical protein